MDKNDYQGWLYRISSGWLKTFMLSHKVKGIYRMSFNRQVFFYFSLYMNSQQTFEAIMHYKPNKAIRFVSDALLALAED